MKGLLFSFINAIKSLLGFKTSQAPQSTQEGLSTGASVSSSQIISVGNAINKQTDIDLYKLHRADSSDLELKKSIEDEMANRVQQAYEEVENAISDEAKTALNNLPELEKQRKKLEEEWNSKYEVAQAKRNLVKQRKEDLKKLPEHIKQLKIDLEKNPN
ncbi:MAG: hypothetical protein JJU12_05830 [Chlamydiales bacterium]|nr:hypothetical protein [Chlamydiales bacterium]